MKPGMRVWVDGREGRLLYPKLRTGEQVWAVYWPGTIEADWIAMEDIECTGLSGSPAE